MSENGVLYRLEYSVLLGDVVAALLMSQIHYWYTPADGGGSKLRVYKEGYWWIAKSLPEWAEECGITTKQARRGLSVLEACGLIEMSVFKFNKIPTTHLRFTLVKGRGPLREVPAIKSLSEVPELAKSLLSTPSPAGLDPAPGDLPPAPQGRSITEITHETTHEIKSGGCATASTAEQEPPMAIPSVKGKIKVVSEDVLTRIKSKPKTAAVDHVATPAGMYKLWVEAVPEYFPQVGCQKKFTLKQSKFVKTMIEVWGEPVAPSVLTYVIANWTRFTKYAESMAGAFKSPLLPSVDYLHRYHAEAKNFWLARDTSQEVCMESVKPISGELVKLVEGPGSSPEVIPGAKATPPPKAPQSSPAEGVATLEDILSWKPSV